MKKFLLFLLFAVLAIGAVLFFFPVSERLAGERDVVKETLELKLAVVTDAKPEFTSDKNNPWAPYFRLIFEPLVQLSGSEVLPVLASSWLQSDKEVVIILRPGITFSDGIDLTSQDVVFSLEFAKERKLLPESFFALYSSVKTDGSKIIFALKAPTPDFLAKLSNVYIVQQNAKQKDNQLIGTGPLIADGSFARERDDYSRTKPLLKRVVPSAFLSKQLTEAVIKIGTGEIDALLINKEKADPTALATIGLDEVKMENSPVSLYLAQRGYAIETTGVWTLADLGTKGKESYKEEIKTPLYKYLLRKYNLK